MEPEKVTPTVPPPAPRPRVAIMLLVIIGLVGLLYMVSKLPTVSPTLPPGTTVQTFGDFKKFATEAEFKAYIEKAQELNAGYGGIARDSFGLEGRAMAPQVINPAPMATTDKAMESAPDRVSSTNVQVKGIDEPDIVKTNGREIFVSNDAPYYILERPLPASDVIEDRMIAPYPPQQVGKTNIVSAFPVENLAKLSDIDLTGELLLHNERLMVIGGNIVKGFDVSDTQSPSEKWEVELGQKQQIVASRLNGGKLYIVASTYLDYGRPCPIPLTTGANALTIACTDIYYPGNPVAVDTTYTVLVVNPDTGATEKTVTFVGKLDTSIVYMSADNLYVTYSYSGDMYQVTYDFFKNVGQSLVTPEVLQKLERLHSYDLSLNTKLTELQTILEKHYQTLSDDERLRIQNETENKMSDYLKERARELERTGIVKIALNDLGIAETGEVSGRPLNQFAMDEYEENLRIATTFGGNWWGIGTQSESASDVYVLGSNLDVRGAVTDLGVTERIYSVRFIKDQAYVVTFRQTDPFYVLNLSNPTNPQKTGELKIPGFSSYLHPLTDTMILGVGQENGQVKLSLFDVSNPANPVEADKYMMDEYWTEVQNNHHAFLQDEKHQVFFLPGGQGGYIMSYQGNKLALTKAVSGEQVKRALFINDYLYIVGNTEITVLDEQNWSEVKSLSLN